MADSYVGKSCARVDGLEKVTGRARFGADLHFPDELVARVLRAPVPRASIANLDVSAALSLPGVAAAATAADVPGRNEMFGRFPVFAAGETRYSGDAIAAVAAEDERSAERALAAIRFEYRALPGVWTLDDASAPGLAVHADAGGNEVEAAYYPLRFGDAEAGFAEAELKLERSYSVGFQEHAYIENESVVVVPAPFHHGIEIYGCIQNPYTIRSNVAAVLGLSEGKVRVVTTAIGGSFGGKDESVMTMAARCAVLALKAGRPVRMDFSREDSFLESCKRHPFRMDYAAALGSDGTLRAVDARLVCQGGAYNNKARFSNWRAAVHAAGAYRVPHARADVSAKYTNTVYGGAFRGFSGPQVLFAVETLADEAASELGMNPKDFRLRNALREGDSIACGQVLKSGSIAAPLPRMIEDIARKTDFDRKWSSWPEENERSGDVKKGIGIAVNFRGAGLGGEGVDCSSAALSICRDGSVILFSGHTEMGQGMRTAHSQIAAEELGISIDKIDFRHSDTSATFDAGPTVASRGTQSGGRAVLDGARKLRERLLDAAEKKTGRPRSELSLSGNAARGADGAPLCSYEELVSYCYYPLGIDLSARGWYSPGLYEIDHRTQQGTCYQTYTFGVAVAEISVDTATGKVRADRISLAYELGKAINPQLAYGQLVGGLMQGLGYALFEELEEEEGVLRTRNFDDYLIPTTMDLPEIDLSIYESENPEGPYGAKGIGELGVELIAPCIGNALFHATGRRLRDLPFNLERVLLGAPLRRS